MSKVLSLAKKSIASCCQSSDGWVSEKTGKWSVGEGRKHSVTSTKHYSRHCIQTKYVLCKNKQDPVLGNSIDKNRRVISDVLASDGYSKLGPRSKVSQKLMFSKKRALISYFPYFSQTHGDL